MKVLALSTAEQDGSLAFADGSRLIHSESWDVSITHSKRLLSMIQASIENKCRMNLADVDLFIAAKGPGSFTGLRIGISVVKGLSMATGKACAGASSLDGIAFQFDHAPIPVCVMMDAKRQEVYTATYRFDRGQLVSKSKEIVCAPDQVLSAQEGRVLYVGSGARTYERLIRKKETDACFGHPFQQGVNAVGLLKALGLPRKEFNSTLYPLEPVYLRKSDAELNFEKMP